jgi:transposase
MAYDSKFRNRVIAYKDSGHTFAEVYEAFGVTAYSYYKWKEQLETNGDFVYNYPKEHKGKISTERLLELLQNHPDWYLREFAEALGVCHQAVQKKFAKLGITHKKNFYLFGEIRRKATGVLKRSR